MSMCVVYLSINFSNLSNNYIKVYITGNIFYIGILLSARKVDSKNKFIFLNQPIDSMNDIFRYYFIIIRKIIEYSSYLTTTNIKNIYFDIGEMRGMGITHTLVGHH